MLGDSGEDLSIVPVVYPHGAFSVSSLGAFLYVGSSSKTSRPYLPVYIVARHIQEYFNNKKGRKQKFINPQQEKSRHEDRRKKISIIVLANLVIGFCDLIPLEAGADGSEEQDTATVTKEVEEPEAKRMRILGWKEDNWTTLKKALERRRNPEVNGVCV